MLLGSKKGYLSYFLHNFFKNSKELYDILFVPLFKESVKRKSSMNGKQSILCPYVIDSLKKSTFLSVISSKN